MDKKTLTYITVFTAIIAVVLGVYVLSSLFIKPKSTTPTTNVSQPKDTEVIFPKITPSFTFSPKEPENARVVVTPPPSGEAVATPATPERPPQLIKIDITTNKFTPQTVTIEKGDVITWTNSDSVPHKLIGKSWRSGVIQPTRAFSQQFDVSGTYQYYTEANPLVTGTITVN